MCRRPDALGSWNGPLDCENQGIIHGQCVEQAGMWMYRHMLIPLRGFRYAEVVHVLCLYLSVCTCTGASIFIGIFHLALLAVQHV